MFRSISAIITSFTILLLISGTAYSQNIMIRDSDPEVVALSAELTDQVNVFDDTDNDGIYDKLTVDGEEIQGDIIKEWAEGFQYQDNRYIVLYPADTLQWESDLPAPGTSELLGFIHYFDGDHLSAYLAIVAEQALGDDTTNGLGVFFYDSAGLRVGAPTTMFMEKARLRANPIYQEWVSTARDFGIGSNPDNSQIFVLAKDLGLTDYVLIVMFQLYQ